MRISVPAASVLALLLGGCGPSNKATVVAHGGDAPPRLALCVVKTPFQRVVGAATVSRLSAKGVLRSVVLTDDLSGDGLCDVLARITEGNSTYWQVHRNVEIFSMPSKKLLRTLDVPGGSKQIAEALAEAFAAGSELDALARAAAPAAAPAAPTAPRPAAKSFRSEVESPSFRLPEDASKFAMVVGIERYASLPEARFAARDAAAMKANLLAAGYPERNIVFLKDQEASKSGLEKYLDAWLPMNTDEGSSVLFYFSGHGAPDTADGQAYLVPWDGDPKFLASTGYPVKRLYERLNALKAGKVLVAMDSCFSGTGGRSVLARGTRPLVAKLDLGPGASGRVQALAAAASDEITGTDEESGHGLFTYQLLKGLSAKGGKATFKELHDYLAPKVRDAARRDNRDQTPQLLGRGDAAL